MYDNLWIITPGALASMERAEALARSGHLAPVAAAPATRTRTDSSEGVAHVPVLGILTPAPDRFAAFFGANTTYSQILDDLTRAAGDSSVRRIELFVDSPGGSVDGLFEVTEAIEAIRAGGKPITVRARNALSAGYIIAAAAGPITATSASASFGSVGVAVAMYLPPNVAVLTNTESRAKRPDPMTPEGQATVREHLDAVHSMAARAIAKGRARSASGITEAFGGGRTLLAEQALGRGMIDTIDRASVTVRKSPMALAESLVGRMEGRPVAADSPTDVAAFAGPDMQDRVAERLFGRREGGDVDVMPEAPRLAAASHSGSDMQDRVAERLFGAMGGEERPEPFEAPHGRASYAPGSDMQDRIAARLTGQSESQTQHLNQGRTPHHGH